MNNEQKLTQVSTEYEPMRKFLYDRAEDYGYVPEEEGEEFIEELEYDIKGLKKEVALLHETLKVAWTSLDVANTELVRMRERHEKEVQNLKTNEEVRELHIAELNEKCLKDVEKCLKDV
jgi:Na+/phosphate symporter